MRDQSLLFKIVPSFIVLVGILILGLFVVIGIFTYNTMESVNEVGVKGVLEQVWCGKQHTNCKLLEGVELR